MPPECWAAVNGDCEGPITGEHLLTHASLGPTVSVRGFRWCAEDFKSVGTSGLTCNCLCAHHNSILSPTDQEYLRFKESLEGALAPRPARSPFFAYEVDGLRFGRWIAKTVCTQAAANRHRVPTPLARYAFAKTDDPTIRIYCSFQPGARLSFDMPHFGSRWVHDETDEDRVAVHVKVFDFPLIISTFSLRPFWPDLAPMLDYPAQQINSLLDRVARLDFNGPKGPRGCILVRWPSGAAREQSTRT